MPPAPLPENEEQRLGKLEAYAILDTPPEAAFDRVTAIARRLFDTPISLISLVDRDRQWFKSRAGLDATETPRDLAFCAHAILDNAPLVVEDATADPRFATNPLVTEAPEIRFYAGAPLTTHDGFNLGTLCVIDTTPRRFSIDQRAAIADLAQIAVDEIELRQAARFAVGENARLVRANASKDEFITLVSHELRTPLTAIIGAITLLGSGAAGPLSEKAGELTAMARRNGESLRKLIDDLLDFQKQRAGMLEFEFSTVSPCEIMQATVADMGGYADMHDVHLAMTGTTAEADRAAVLGDPVRLQQVLRNLISNAVKFSPAGDTVEIGLAVTGTAATLSVADHGPGIPADFQSRMFQMFSKAGGYEQPAGTGVGLALSKAIVEAHGGVISFSTAPGEGTTFCVELPLQEVVLYTVEDRLRA